MHTILKDPLLCINHTKQTFEHSCTNFSAFTNGLLCCCISADMWTVNLSSIHDAVVYSKTIVMKIWRGWGHKHDRNVHRFYIKLLTDSSTV